MGTAGCRTLATTGKALIGMAFNNTGYAVRLFEQVRQRYAHQRHELNRWSVRRRLGNDPTQHVHTPSESLGIAQALLDHLPRQSGDAHQLWTCLAVQPLAQLLYAASRQHGESNGMDWVATALVGTEAAETAPGWRQAANIWSQGTALPERLLPLANLAPRQRNSITEVMHSAIAPWLHSCKGDLA